MKDILSKLKLSELNNGTSTGQQFFGLDSAKIKEIFSPVDAKLIAKVKYTTKEEYEKVMSTANEAFKVWRKVPAPKRGEIIRQYGNLLRENKEYLGKLVSYEMGKSLQEGLGEVQEMIDICDFAVGLSRQLYGLTMHSERTDHRMYEQWHPLGIIGIIWPLTFRLLYGVGIV